MQVADLQNDTLFLAILVCWVGTIFEIRKSHIQRPMIFIALSSISMSQLRHHQIKEMPPRMKSAAAFISGNANGVVFRS
ncbi:MULTISPECIES: hypothetical protein [unclassified Bradyrhizobium]|uniref:hypothetical protein n=1 Tax=unclassified Bradyrhizobium TaxID=2631580 RepID=UPI002FF21C3A